jgi:hypothetical protein
MLWEAVKPDPIWDIRVQRDDRPVTRRQPPVMFKKKFNELLAVDQSQLGSVAF